MEGTRQDQGAVQSGQAPASGLVKLGTGEWVDPSSPGVAYTRSAATGSNSDPVPVLEKPLRFKVETYKHPELGVDLEYEMDFVGGRRVMRIVGQEPPPKGKPEPSPPAKSAVAPGTPARETVVPDTPVPPAPDSRGGFVAPKIQLVRTEADGNSADPLLSIEPGWLEEGMLNLRSNETTLNVTVRVRGVLRSIDEDACVESLVAFIDEQSMGIRFPTGTYTLTVRDINDVVVPECTESFRLGWAYLGQTFKLNERLRVFVFTRALAEGGIDADS